MLGLTKSNLNALEALLELPTTKTTVHQGIIVNCGGCTSLHHNN
jgi:hypothetical protein